MKIYKDFSIIPAWNYIQVLDTGNLVYLYILDNYYELPEIKDDLSVAYHDITIQYMKYRYPRTTFIKHKELMDNTLRYDQSSLLIYFIQAHPKDEEMIKRLANWGYGLDKNNLEQSIEKVKHSINNLKNVIEIQSFEIEKEKGKVNKDIWKSIRAIKKVCGEFDLKQISLKEFAAIEKNYEEEVNKIKNAK